MGNMPMYRILIALMLLCVPYTAAAHATPVESTPASSEQLTEQPQEIRIRFSERLERGSSRMQLSTLSGELVASEARVDSQDSRVLLLPLPELPHETYRVSWSVVSEDDGHFTKGAFGFSMGDAPPPQLNEMTVVQISSTMEAFFMSVEFLGNSLAWGILLLMVFFLAPRLQARSHEALQIKRYATTGVIVAACIGALGALAQIAWKARELALLHEESYSLALSAFIQTMAGTSAIVRVCALGLFALLFVLLRGHLVRGSRLFASIVVAPLLVFALFRALVSHATANPFVPELSVLVNIVHLIEKDIWFGVVLTLAALYVLQVRALPALLPRVYLFLAVNVGGIALTASYIIWLHLKSVKNLTTTLWGEHALMLFASAGLLLALRTVSSLYLRYAPTLFARSFGILIGAELFAAGAVIFFTSVVISTSPPLHGEPATLTVRDQGVEFKLSASPFEEGKALLEVSQDRDLTVHIGREDALLVDLEKRFAHGYVFPLEYLATSTLVRVTAVQEGAYDAKARFDIREPLQSEGRSFDRFTGVMSIVGLLGIACAVLLHMRVRFAEAPPLMPRSFVSLALGFLIGGVFLSQALSGAHAAFANEFKAACIRDGNAWHSMLPMKASVPVHTEAQEGCMAIAGTYHMSDAREYEYLRTLPAAVVDVSPDTTRPNVPTNITVSLTERDGTPALLGIEHEKILHLILISEDKSDFAHLHPQQLSPGVFRDTYAFPVAGTYLAAVDYLHGLTHATHTASIATGESKTPIQRYTTISEARGVQVALEYVPPLVGNVSLLRFSASESGKPVTDFEPYLGAAMHLAIVNDDASVFMHTHGEVHQAGAPVLPPTLHAHAPPPPRFGPIIESHVAFEKPGIYTIFGELQRKGEVIPVRFTIRVD